LPFTDNIIISRTIEDAWRDALWCVVRNGHDYKIEYGSYVGQIRRQLEHVAIIINEPWVRPLAPISLPGGLPLPTSEEKIERYFAEYIMSEEKEETEDYTYGQAIAPQVPKIIEILNRSKGNSNQACISVSDWNSINLKDPQCLRLVDFKVVRGKLNMSLFFRSWDCFAGLPENLGGLQMLKEYLLIHLNFPVQDGKIIAYSSGLHIYEMYFPIVDMLNVDKIGELRP